MADWRLAAAGPPLRTSSGLLQPVTTAGGSRAMLKVPKPGTDEEFAPDVLAWFAGNGAVPLLARRGGAHLIDWLEGEGELIGMVDRGEDDATTRIVASVVSRLHAPRADAPPAMLIPLERQFRSLFQQAGNSDLFAAGAAIAKRLLATATDAAVLHGDLHHANILRHPAHGWLAIDPKGLLGDPAYDVANTLRNPITHPAIVTDLKRTRRQAAIFATELGFDVRRVLAFAFAHACLSAAWSVEDGDDPEFSFAAAQAFRPLADEL